MVLKSQLHLPLVHDPCEREAGQAVGAETGTFAQAVYITYGFRAAELERSFGGIEINFPQPEPDPPDVTPHGAGCGARCTIEVFPQVKSRSGNIGFIP